MGPDEISLNMARAIKENWPDFAADEYALAYFIQGWCEKNIPEEPTP